MSAKLHQWLANVLAMPHWSNQHAASGTRHNSHEDALARELDAIGFQEDIHVSFPSGQTKKKKKVLKYPALKRAALMRAAQLTGSARQKAIASLVPGMVPGTYIRQPAGSQSFPDFLICDFSGKFVLVEAKSGSGGNPVWNDSLPKKDSIYIMSSGKYDRTTCWLGQDWISDAELAIFDNLYHIIDAAVVQANQQLKTLDHFHRGWQFYSRKKHQQGGLVEWTDPYRHADQLQCEANALAFAKAQ